MLFVAEADNNAVAVFDLSRATVEEILGLAPLSQFDHFGRPLREIFQAAPDLRPYEAITPAQSLTELNPSQGDAARAWSLLDLNKVDAADEDLFNRILWRSIRGRRPRIPARSACRRLNTRAR